jgi:hypothetical protein
MIFVVLTVVALILFVNGLMVLGHYSGKQVAILNLAVGISIGIMGLFIGFTNALAGVGPTQSYVANACCLCFAFTYILLASEIFAGTDFKALGWYCFISGWLMWFISGGFFHLLGTALPYNVQFGMLWACWAILFFLFWACWGLNGSKLFPNLVKFTGYYTIFVALATCLYPAIAFFQFMKIGVWA